MSITVLPEDEIRNWIMSILKQVKDEPVYVARGKDKPIAVLVTCENYKALMERIEDLEDVLAMLEAERLEAIDYDEYIRQR